MYIRQKYINGKDVIVIRMKFNENRIIEEFIQVHRIEDYEPGEYVLPDLNVTTKQYDKILRSIRK